MLFEQVADSGVIEESFYDNGNIQYDRSFKEGKTH